MNTNKSIEKSNYNFTKQLAIYAGVTLFFAAINIGAGLIRWQLWDTQQIAILASLVLGLGFIVYLRQSDYKMDPDLRINDKAALYWVCLWISLIVISNFHRPDIGWANNLTLNLWLIIETLFIAIADEIIFRAFGDYCFPVKGIREEAAMVICYAAFYLYGFAGDFKAGLTGFVLAIGIGTLFTGLYLRYRKLGANILYHFVLIFLMRLTVINSTVDTPVLGKASVFIFALGVLGMVWYGLRLIKAFNEDGILDDARLGYDGPENDFRKAFSESREKYRGKVMDKAEPKVEKNVERYINKQIARAEKQEAKKEAKEKAKRGKTDD